MRNTSDVRSYLLLSDYLSGLENIKKFKCKYDHEVINNIVDILSQIQEYGIVIFTWIPGHVGIPENEETDRIARNATTYEATLIQESAVVSRTEAKTVIKHHCIKM